MALIIVLGVAFIPSLYAWINIYANWDPYGNTGNLRVAVASKDAGYQVEGVSVNMGERVIESLTGAENVDWQFTNEAEARDGVDVYKIQLPGWRHSGRASWSPRSSERRPC